ncbi:MAG: nucleotidyltransferase, partial [Opitutaceae bacterium]
NRCWRLHYKDDIRFHLDGVPCLPGVAERRTLIALAMQRHGLPEPLARLVAEQSVDITDRTLPNYRLISPDWLVSNPEGYARWFESRMRQAANLLEARVREARAASIDDLPAYRWKTPLQRCVQLLKRHRDVMFDALPEAKPISIIITTLAARAYRGEAEVAAAMERILLQMEALVNPAWPRVPNPVNPEEDFADKWSTPEGRQLQLEDNFKRWVAQARADFVKLSGSSDPGFIAEQARVRFRAPVDTAEIRRRLGIGFPNVVVTPRSVPITEPARPWRRS